MGTTGLHHRCSAVDWHRIWLRNSAQLNATQRKYFSSSRLNQPSSTFEVNVQDSFPTWSAHPTWSNLSTWFVISMWSFFHDMIRFIEMILCNTRSNCNSNGNSRRSGGNSNSNRILIRFVTQRYRFPNPNRKNGHVRGYRYSLNQLQTYQSLVVLNHSNSEWYNFLYSGDNESWRTHDNTSCTQLYYRLYQATSQFTALLEISYRIGSINTSSLLYRELLQTWRNESWHIRKIFESHLMESLYNLNLDTFNQQFPSDCLKLEHQQQSKFHLLLNFNTIKSFPIYTYYVLFLYRSLPITSEGVL